MYIYDIKTQRKEKQMTLQQLRPAFHIYLSDDEVRQIPIQLLKNQISGQMLGGVFRK